jgi:hypothetical protein
MNLPYSVAIAASMALASSAFAQPSNDECATAIAIACGQTVSGNTSDALPDEATNCGTTIGAPGVWYVLTGTDELVTATTCPDNTYDTKLNVYVGDCGTITCLVGNDDIAGGVLCSSVGFFAAAGQTYFILVQGYNGAVGSFDLAVTCEAVNEDLCEGALPIACGETLSGSTASATEDTAEECGTPITSAGVWYSLEGVDAQITVTTCPDNQYDTKLNVYSGSCDALECVGGNDDIANGVYCSQVVFDGNAGTTYYILVQGYDGETGDFDLSVTCVSCGTPQNVSIAPLDVSATVNWTSANTNATYTIEYGPAGFTPGTGTLITGTYGVDGPPVTINGLALATEYDLYLQEDCGGGDASTVVGPVAFTTLETAPAVNAYCSGALPIACGGSVTGNTEDGLVASAPTCGAANITTNGLWFTFTGDGQDVTLSTCIGTNFDSKISVFTGSCTSPSCMAGSDDAPDCPGNTSQVTIHTLTGTSYFVLVHGYDQSQGDFTLTMSCAVPCVPVDNDDCGIPTLLSLALTGGCEASTGTTVCAFAPPTPNPPCDPYGNIVDVWYAFNTGWSTNLLLQLAPVDASIINAAIYTACDGAYIECWNEVDGPIDLSGLPDNTDVLLRVWNGGAAEAGSFTVCVEADFNVGVETRTTGSTIALFPVPVREILTAQPLDGISMLHVVDLQGRAVLSLASNNTSTSRIDVSALAPGSYVLLGDGRSLGRFVKE